MFNDTAAISGNLAEKLKTKTFWVFNTFEILIMVNYCSKTHIKSTVFCSAFQMRNNVLIRWGIRFSGRVHYLSPMWVNAWYWTSPDVSSMKTLFRIFAVEICPLDCYYICCLVLWWYWVYFWHHSYSHTISYPSSSFTLVLFVVQQMTLKVTLQAKSMSRLARKICWQANVWGNWILFI